MTKIVPIVLCAALALAACDSSEPAKPPPAPMTPPKPVAAAPTPAPVAPPAPVAAPQPSPDELLAQSVKKALRDTRKVDAQGIDVAAGQGVVTLYGTAGSEAERRKIAKFVASLDGVKSVVNKVVVIRGS
ncbi:MAG: BON domain-containing protein [Burkholderiales bacterium]